MKKKKYIFILSLIFIISGFIIIGKSYSKYVSNIIWNYKLESKGFYFSSSDLNTDSITNVYTNWDGNNITFNINNSNGNYVTTNYDIFYTATCSVIDNPNIKCNMNGTNTNAYSGVLSKEQVCINDTEDMVDVRGYSKTECEVNGYVWRNDVVNKELYFNLESEYEIDDVIVEIDVSSTAPYKKTLKGKYEISKSKMENEKIALNYLDNNENGLLTVSNSYTGIKCARISFDSDKLIMDDNLNINLYKTDENGFINQFDFNINGKDSIGFNFFEKELDVYDSSIFTIVEIPCN